MLLREKYILPESLTKTTCAEVVTRPDHLIQARGGAKLRSTHKGNRGEVRSFPILKILQTLTKKKSEKSAIWFSKNERVSSRSVCEISKETLPEAQRTQIINSVIRVISMTETNYTYFNLFKRRHLVVKFATNGSGVLWWPNLQLIHVVPSVDQICN